MTVAYNELYLDDAMNNLGDMIDYATRDLGYGPDDFFGWFISSGIASKFETGNPKYITGMSGFELAEAVLSLTNISYKKQEPSYIDSKGREYWSGWILAYYQWETNMRFEDMVKNGLTLSTVFSFFSITFSLSVYYIEQQQSTNIITLYNLANKTQIFFGQEFFICL